MRFIRNVQFTCLVKCEGKQREFNFRRRSSTEVPYYHVDTVDLAGTRYQFHMDKTKDQWKIRESTMPVWILDVESQLSTKIIENDVQA